ncbi:MAG: prepilin-type N-terminal cleavage/methylation domain-containing protein [bacterium]
MKQSAFTLIELLIVVAIIGILAAIAVPNFMNARIRAMVAHSRSEQRTYLNVQKMYLMDNGDVPGHYDGQEEHCPFINMGYLSGPLTDPFMEGRDDLEYFQNHEGMYHNTPIADDWEPGVMAANHAFWAEWVANNRPYVVFGEGPMRRDGWAHYDPSNGIHSDGIILALSIRGKGVPTSNLPQRKCQ